MEKPIVNVNATGITREYDAQYKIKILKANIPFDEQVTDENTKYIIRWNFDLDDEEVEIPANCILQFEGGSLSNGTLVGNNTQIIAQKTAIFDGIVIDGTWNATNIFSAWFEDVNSENIIREVFKLTSDVYNVVEIGSGNYTVTFTELNEIAIPLKSNTKVILDGTIIADTNLTHYYIIGAQNVENIEICGSGTINGGRDNHADTGGEWGHCIYFTGVTNLKIKDIHCTKAWGDGIAGYGSNVVIDNVRIDYCRRQGISLNGNINDYTIKNCHISDISGTKPFACVDIEPNHDDLVKNVNIENNIFEGQKGVYVVGIIGTVENVYISNNKFNTTVDGIRGAGTLVSNVIIEHNVINSIVGERIFAIRNNDYNDATHDSNLCPLIVRNNIINGEVAIHNAKSLFEGNVVTTTSNNFSYYEGNHFYCTVIGNTFNNGKFIINTMMPMRNNVFNVTDDTYGMRIYKGILENNIFNVFNSTGTFTGDGVIYMYSNGDTYLIRNIISAENLITWFIYNILNNCTGHTYLRDTIRVNVKNEHYTGNAHEGYSYTVGHSPLNGGFVDDEIIRRQQDTGDIKIKGNKPVFWDHNRWCECDGMVDGIKRTGVANDRPDWQSVYKGYQFFVTGIRSNEQGMPIFCTGETTRRWVCADGSTAFIKTSGKFNEKPTASNIYVGFRYFCTNKQTAEGATNGIEIIFKGQDTTDPDNPVDIWVDALGRVVS